MTGDITPKIMSEIAKLDNNSEHLQKKRFDIIKAPHHGTQSCYFDFSKYYNFEKLYISNGETTWSNRSRGKISNDYFLQAHSHKIVCSDTPLCRCEFFCNKGKCADCCE